MHKYVCFNKEFLSTEKARISAVSSAALYGRGIFTSIAIIDGKPFLWEKHWRRLTENAAQMRIDLTKFSEKEIVNSLFETIARNNFSNGRARITFFDEAASRIWHYETAKGTSFLITTADLHKAKKNLRLTVSPFTVNSFSPLAGVKSCNYAENIFASEEAKERGFDEAVRINERGEIVSACLANVFWLKDGVLYTPSLETGCLRGTTRDFLKEKFNAAEAESFVEVLTDADAIFLTSAGIGVARVSAFETKIFTRNFTEITDFSHI